MEINESRRGAAELQRCGLDFGVPTRQSLRSQNRTALVGWPFFMAGFGLHARAGVGGVSSYARMWG
jgi:hypothetical protein